MNFADKKAMQAAFSQMIPDSAVMDCDFCHRPMTFEEYRTHHCDGLGGRNPFTERTKASNWKFRYELSAKGHVITRASRVRRRLFAGFVWVMMAAGLALVAIWFRQLLS